MTDLEIYDTTLRDGSQQEGISLTVGDKLRIASLLDELGVAYVEGGWPGALPKDDEFFARARKDIDFRHATLVAFGSTRRPGSTSQSGHSAASPPRCRNQHDLHRRQDVGLPRARGAANRPRRRAPDDLRVGFLPTQQRPTGVLRRRALLRRLSRASRIRPQGAPGCPRSRS